MTLLLKLVKNIRKHALIFWKYDEEVLDTIEMTKIDVTIDLSDSLLPTSLKLTYKTIKTKLQQSINKIFTAKDSNFSQTTKSLTFLC